MHNALPQLDRLFVTDAGLETDMIYNRGVDLPCFASITMLRDAQGRELLRDYFRGFIELAGWLSLGCLLESASWRASPDWGPKIGIGEDEFDRLNAASVQLLKELRDEYRTSGIPILISGCIGPRGDGYDPGQLMNPSEAESYHLRQAAALASAGPDLISAITMTNADEAIGIARAAGQLGLPAVISFTVETDGRLPTGQSLEEAVGAVDGATGDYPAYYMINCAHPTHFQSVLEAGGEWARRLGGIRANASRCSHAEVDAMTELDSGDPAELARLYREIRERLPQVRVIGGCCGTDIRHVMAVAEACAARDPLASAA